jgi:hypothetical protein
MRSVSLIFILLLLFGCDKEKQTSRKIEGEWTLIHIKITFPDGLSEFGTGTGTLIISESDQDAYQRKFERITDVTFPSSTYQEMSKGYMNFKNKGNYSDTYLMDESNTIVFQEEHRILMLTKTDLQIEYSNSTGRFITQTFRREK